jgi:hypothetical protein
MIDAMDMRGLPLGNAKESGRDAVLYLQSSDRHVRIPVAVPAACPIER